MVFQRQIKASSAIVWRDAAPLSHCWKKPSPPLPQCKLCIAGLADAPGILVAAWLIVSCSWTGSGIALALYFAQDEAFGEVLNVVLEGTGEPRRRAGAETGGHQPVLQWDQRGCGRTRGPVFLFTHPWLIVSHKTLFQFHFLEVFIMRNNVFCGS